VAAIALYKQHEASGTLPETKKREVVYENYYERKKSLRLLQSHLGVLGIRTELLDLEEDLLPGLRKACSVWDTSAGNRTTWLLSCRDSTSVSELAQLLSSLEEQVRALQRVTDAIERKPWRSEGQDYIGKNVRRFFNTSDGGHLISDGKIVGWLPPEGEDEALWHMVHGDDLDEEDLDEAEAKFAMANYYDGRTEPSEEEVAYAAKFAAQQLEAVAVDSDPDEDPEDEDHSEAPSRAAPSRHGRAPANVLDSRRLWVTAESRERWRAVLASPTTQAATVGLAIAALRQHCRWFGVLSDPKADKKQSRAFLHFQVHSWCHATALGPRVSLSSMGSKKHKLSKMKPHTRKGGHK